MKVHLSLILLLVVFTIQAQEVPFEKLDSVSTLISQLQKQTDSKTYKDLKGDTYMLSFPEENFKVYYYDKLASKAVYKKWGDKEVLALTENIDFSKATGISVGEDYNGVAYIKVDFPKQHLKTQIIENGNIINTVSENYLEFFCRYGTLDTDKKFLFDKMYDYLYALSTQLKIEKNLMTENDVKNELADWGKISSEAFFKKYPNSLMVAQINQNKEDALKKNQKFILEFAKRYYYMPGLSIAEYASLSADNKRLADKKTNKNGIKSNMKFISKDIGPFELTLKNDKVVQLQYLLTSKKQTTLQLVEKLISEIRQKIDAAYIRDGRSQYSGKYDFDYYVDVPGAGLSVDIIGRGNLYIRFSNN